MKICLLQFERKICREFLKSQGNRKDLNWYERRIIMVSTISVSKVSQVYLSRLISGRCSIHVAVLMENEEIVEHLASNFKSALKIGDNVRKARAW